MDLATFTRFVTSSTRTKDELRQMMDNALNEGAQEHAAVAREQLDQRFPGWNVVQARRGGSKQTVVTFRAETRDFPSAKEAYIWLVGCFIQTKPEIFSDPSDDLVYLALGEQRNYFARSVAPLFHGSPHLAENPNNFTLLANGWFANLVLSNAAKFDILIRFGALTGLEYGMEWDWMVLDSTEELLEKQTAVGRSRELIKKLRAAVQARKSAGQQNGPR